MLNPWDLDNIADGDAQNFANVESLIWSHMMDVLAAEQKKQPDDAKPSEWQQAMLDHANEVRKFAEQVTGKPQKDAMLTLQTKLGPMTYNNMKRAEAWLKAHTHKPVVDIKDSKQIAKIVEAGQVKGEKYINLARRNMSDNALTQFDKIISTASLNMRNGTTNQKALSQAVKQWADQGVPALIDKAGRHWSPDVYMRTVIESAVNQTTNDTELARYKQYGSLVRVDSHAGCRPSHLQFQDHIYSLTGDTEKYPDFESTTGYGTITGIGGINCRHHTLPYVEGEGYMKVPQMSADDNAALYANKQVQRRLESNVRKAKRQLEAAEKLGDPADIANAKQLVTRRQTAVREFVNDKGLTRRYYREKINVIKGPENISSVVKTESMNIDELENMFVNDQIKNAINDDEKVKTIVSTLFKAPDNIKAMYEKYSDKMKITTVNGNGSSFYSSLYEAVSFNHDSLFLDKEMTKNTRVMNEVYYHEFGHMIDDFSNKKAFEKTSESAKYDFKAKLNNDFQNIVNSEIDNINKNGLPKEKVFHDDVINTDYYGEMYGLMIKRKKNGKLTQSSIKKIAVKKVIDDMLEKATATETSWKPYTNIADMFEAATKGNYRTGFGHGKKYWKNPGMQEAEAFAEMTSSSVCNPESLKLIKQYFPTAYETYLQMIADIAKE